ncbi:MAG: hypothetical protein Q9191_001741 [Dirinaria sp. TL-2023a]
MSLRQDRPLVWRQVPSVPARSSLQSAIRSMVSAELVGLPGRRTPTGSFVPTYSKTQGMATEPVFSDTSTTIIQAASTKPMLQNIAAAASVKTFPGGTTTQAQQPVAQTIIAASTAQSASQRVTRTRGQSTMVGANRHTLTSPTLHNATATISSGVVSSIGYASANPDVALTSSRSLATSSVPPSSQLQADRHKTSSASLSVPGPTSSTSSSTSTTKIHHALSPGTKAAIALGVLVFVLIVAILATFFWRSRRSSSKASSRSNKDLPQRPSKVLRCTSLLDEPQAPAKIFSTVHEQHPATVWESKQKHEMALVTTPRFNSWAPAATSVSRAELDGGWGPSEMDGRPSNG